MLRPERRNTMSRGQRAGGHCHLVSMPRATPVAHRREQPHAGQEMPLAYSSNHTLKAEVPSRICVPDFEGPSDFLLSWNGRFVRPVQREERTLNRFYVWALFHRRHSNSQSLSSCHDRAGS
jgi:hypothetical protein